MVTKPYGLGEIRGTVHSTTLQKFDDAVQLGCVIHMKNVSIFRPSSGKPSLVVTANNVARIVRANGRDDVVVVDAGIEGK
ncbi:hypothetical protein HK405_006621 [Cladochytrium tenue]|nr:hypothetical protein HK405_006621 [Cladochytrium tenue]